jgi:hypothetical protein
MILYRTTNEDLSKFEHSLVEEEVGGEDDVDCAADEEEAEEGCSLETNV